MTALLVIVAYLVVLLGVGFFATRLFRGTGEDFFLASHSIGPVLLLMSLFGTTMTLLSGLMTVVETMFMLLTSPAATPSRST